MPEMNEAANSTGIQPRASRPPAGIHASRGLASGESACKTSVRWAAGSFRMLAINRDWARRSAWAVVVAIDGVDVELSVGLGAGKQPQFAEQLSLFGPHVVMPH